jgi:2-polyprenyl-6-methoxyphenol hydroxylase-like FAD-dependent oxidoreductase
MTCRLQRVCVIGAGLAGLACALAASRRGLQVQVLDERGMPADLDAHVEVVPNMLRDLVELGVADDCVRAGFAYSGVDVIDRHGRLLHQLPTAALAGPRYPAALGIAHGTLHQVLSRAAQSGGVALTHGARVTAVRMQGDQARVELDNGESSCVDLVVLAAGTQTPLRKALFPRAMGCENVGQAWWYALVQRPVDLNRPLIAVGGVGQRVVLVPVRNDVAGLAFIEPMCAVRPASPLAHLREALQQFAPGVRSVAGQLTAQTQIVLRPVHTGLLEPPWHHEAVLAVGDCAHALPPHFGQAAAQAIEDARVLGDILAEASDRAALFERFQARRLARAQRVHALTMRAARWDLEPDSEADLGLLMGELTHTLAQPA